MLIQIDIPKELNKKLKIEKIESEAETMQAVVISIIKKHYERK